MTEPLPEQDEGWRHRCSARLAAMMEVLDKKDGPVLLPELQDAVAEVVPLEPYDLTTTSTGSTRAWVNLGWNISGYQHAGWLHVSDPGLRITSAGRAALREHPDPDELFSSADVPYRQWDAARREPLPDWPANPEVAIVHAGSGTAHVLRSTSTLLAAWRAGGSALKPGAAAWTPEASSALQGYLDTVRAPMPPTLPGLDHDGARLLAAEGLELLLGPFTGLSGTLKRKRVRNPLLLMGDPPGLPAVLSADLEHGFIPEGKPLAADPVSLLRSLCVVLTHWWNQDSVRQDEAWSNPWACRDLLAEVVGADERVLSLLCLLTHPGAFTTVLVPAERQRIVDAYAHRVDALTGDLDRDLLAVTLALQASEGGQGIQYQEPPWAQAWSGQAEATRAWLVRGEVDQQNRVPTWTSQSLVTLTVGRLTQLPTVLTQGSLGALIDDLYGDMAVVKREAKRRDVWSFVLAMQPGDLVATVDGATLRMGRLLDGAAERDSLGGSTVLRRAVSWSPDTTPDITSLAATLRSRLRFPGDDVVNLTEVSSALEALLDDDEPEPDDTGATEDPDIIVEPPVQPVVVAELKCDTVALAAQLHHSDDTWLRELLISLNERRQVVLEGPPGTGKTFLARAFLKACGLTEGQQALVQFHPTYSYEDFVEGFRPVPGADSGTGVHLAVTPGPLKRIADEARNAPGKAHVLLIDEINRANIAKVFGELYFLLEYRDEEIELLYSDGSDRFSLPDNLFLIGTMNTADRSIALLDAAMRRRFVFLSMDTSEPALTGVLRRWCEANGRPVAVADLLDRVNKQMVQRGLDPSLTFGPSYFMRPHTADPATLDRIWRRELLPMLRELHYDAQDQLGAWYPFANWMTELGLVPEPASAGPSE